MIAWITDRGAFAALADEWDAALRPPTPFMTHAWLLAWWDAFGTSAGAMRVCTMREDGRLVAALPLHLRRGTLRAWANADTDTVVPLGDPHALARAVHAERWSLLHLPGLPDPAPFATGRTIVEPYDDSPIIETTTSFDDYRAGLGKSTRQRIGKALRRLERAHEVTITTLVQPAGVEAALALEHAGWKGRNGSSVLSDPQRTALYRALAPHLHGSELRVDVALAAFDLALVHDRRVASLLTSYDERLAKHSPGLLLRMALVEHCCASDLVANDLLGTKLDWKQSLATTDAPTQTLRAYRGPAGTARYVGRRTLIPAARRAKDALAARRSARARGDAAAR